MKLPQTILITGYSGFVGTHLIRALSGYSNGRLFGISRGATPKTSDSSAINAFAVDLTNPMAVKEAIREIRPEWIFHLAGQAVVADSWRAPAATFQTNALAQIHLLEAVKEFMPRARLLTVGSSEQYGQLDPAELPVRETQSFRPLSPYAVSKIAQDHLAYQYFRSYGIDVIRTRTFNHTGPGRPDVYAISSFCRQIARIELQLAEPILRVGNLSARRDYLDVRDVVVAYLQLMEKGHSGEAYNICSGHSQSMESIVAELLQRTKIKIRVEQDPTLYRPSDIPDLYGDASKLRETTGWRPHYEFQQTLTDLLDYWRIRERASSHAITPQA